MRFIKATSLLLLLSHLNLYSQINIQIRIKQAITKKAYIYLYQDNSKTIIDSSIQVSPGMFRFTLPENHSQGVYKLALGNNISFDFVVAEEPEISLETVVYAPEDSLKSIISKENEVYFAYKKFKKSRSQQQYFLNSLKDYYTDSSSFWSSINAEQLRIKNEVSSYAFKAAKESPSLFASTLMKAEQSPIPPSNLSADEKKIYLTKNWWKNVNLKDKRLINTPSFNKKLWDYIDLYFNENLDKEEQDSAIIEGIKTVLSLDADISIMDYFRKTLYSDFIDTDYSKTTLFLEKFHIEGATDLTPSNSNIFKNDVGSKAYDFKVEESNGKTIKLSKIPSNIKLLVFWSLWCPHCTEMIPELNKTYQTFKEKGFETIAISIDSEAKEWRKYIEDNKLNWLNMLEPDNGKSTILSKYYVEETPMLFLLDKDLKIISRPANVKQLYVKLKKLLK